jgi:putative ABC transport system permease protein
MVISETIAVATDSIRANKMRAGLTMLGIVIGIAAVIAMVALGEGAQRSVQDRLRALGTAVLTVRPGQEFFGGIGGDAALTIEDAEALLAETENVKDVTPQTSERFQVTYGNANANLQAVGVWPAYFSIQNTRTEAGRIFTPAEERGRRRVAVLGALVGDRFEVPTAALVGQTVQIRGVPFEVIGVLAERGGQGGFFNPDEQVYIPLATAQFRVFGSDRVETIDVQAVSEERLDAALGEIDAVLRRSHRIQPGEPSDFTIRSQATFLETFEETSRTFSFLLAGIALVSLLVGGIGIMNIMLVSVTERTREIGVRKALGARRRDILLQFVMEALVLCLAGGAVGVAVGVGAAFGLQKLAGWNTVIAPEAILLAIGFSGAVGLFFGFWPAFRAARLDPIVSLRYE